MQSRCTKAFDQESATSKCVSFEPGESGSLALLNPPAGFESERMDLSAWPVSNRTARQHADHVTAARLLAGVEELHEDWRGRPGTVWTGLNGSGDTVYVRTLVDSRNGMKEVAAYRLSRSFEGPLVPVTVPLEHQYFFFFRRDGQYGGCAPVSGSAQLEVPAAVKVQTVLGFDWMNALPPALVLFQVLTAAGDPNSDNHPATPLVARAALPRLEDYFHAPESFPRQPAVVFRIDWEAAFDRPAFEKERRSRGAFPDALIRACQDTDDGRCFMERLYQLPADWVEEALEGLWSVDRCQRTQWMDAVLGGQRYLTELFEERGKLRGGLN